MISNWHWPFLYNAFVFYLFYDVYVTIKSISMLINAIHFTCHKNFVYFTKIIFPTGTEN